MRSVHAGFVCLLLLALCVGCDIGYDEALHISACKRALEAPNSMPDATVGLGYRARLYDSLVGGVGGSSLIESAQVAVGSLPPGLSIEQATLSIVGTPTSAGTYPVGLDITGECRHGRWPVKSSAEIDIVIQVNALSPLAISTATLPDGTVGQSYGTQLQATAGSGALTWSLVAGSGNLPAGLNMLNSGFIAGIPTTAGAFTFTAQVRDSASPPATVSRQFTITITPGNGPLAITTATLPDGTEDDNYDATVQTSGGVPPLSFTVASGALPTNITLNPATGAFSGFHGAGGAHTFTIRVEDSGNPRQIVSQAYSIRILEVTTQTLPDGVVGQAYSQTLGVRGEVPPVTWDPAPGTTMPANFTLSSAGVLSGTPIAAGQSFFCARVSDSGVPARADTHCYVLNVTGVVAGPVPTITLLTPATAIAGGAAFVLTVDGTNFDAGAIVRWNGANRTTTFVSSTQLTAQITAADIVAAGGVSVTVANPAAVGGAISAPATFTVTAPPGGSVGVTNLISQSSLGIPANDNSAITGTAGRLIAISDDGNRVAFSSEATNLDSPHPGVFVRDVALGATRRVSSTLLDASPDAVVGESLAITADGNFVAFDSRANNHVPGDSGADSDVFVVATCIQQQPVICPAPDWISVMPDGSEPLFGGSNAPSFGAGSRFVAFSSNSPLTGLNTGRNQIYLRDRQMNVTTLVSVDDLDNAGAGDSFNPSMSENGRFVVFVSNAFNLVADDTNNLFDVFVRDTCFAAQGPCTPSTTRVSVDSDEMEAIGTFIGAHPPSISADGRFVVFSSEATNLVPGDTNNGTDVFVRDRQDSTTTRVSLAPNGSQAFGFNGNVDDDGRFVVFEGLGQALVYDTCFQTAGCTPGSFIVSRRPNGPSANPAADQPVISGDARWVAFHSPDTSLLSGIGTAVPQIFRAGIGN